MSESPGSRSSIYGGYLHSCSMLSLLISGLFIEPAVHPKPGAVTRLKGHRDKSFMDFLYNNSIAATVLSKACWEASLGRLTCIYGRAFRELAGFYRRYMRTNTSMGSWFLHLPLAVALGVYGPVPVPDLASRAARILRSVSEPCDTQGYYRLLATIAPSHLGRLYHSLPDALSGHNGGMPRLWDVVAYAASTDIVHREVVVGYSESITRYRRMVELAESMGLEEAASTVFLEMMASIPDTLIRRKYGTRASLRVREMAKLVVRGVSSIDELDWFMRGMDYNAGSLLDILSVAISFYMYETLRAGEGLV